MSTSITSSSRPDDSREQTSVQKRTRASNVAKVRKPRARFDPNYERLLDKLIAARKAAGIRQETIAKALGKTQSHVSMCESRERELSIIDLWKWCLALEITLSDFVREIESGGKPDLEREN